MKKIKLLQLPKTVAKIDEKLRNIEQLLLERNNLQNTMPARYTFYYSSAALKILTRVIDYIVKLVDVYNKMA